ncbi:MAG TPA: formate dehydrogenase subunit delta [Candidatus Binataceae bacterium]|jgi:formate dehydrogenase subunit delta|nr:formate dehydrogenase subunit delta [Candidatus Binataceae bacterium]
MELHKLITMANEIGGFFAQLPDREEATSSIATHIRNFWEPRMRREIIAYAREDGSALHELVRAAILRLETPR